MRLVKTLLLVELVFEMYDISMELQSFEKLEVGPSKKISPGRILGNDPSCCARAGNAGADPGGTDVLK